MGGALRIGNHRSELGRCAGPLHAQQKYRSEGARAYSAQIVEQLVLITRRNLATLGSLGDLRR